MDAAPAACSAHRKLLLCRTLIRSELHCLLHECSPPIVHSFLHDKCRNHRLLLLTTAGELFMPACTPADIFLR